MITHIPRVNAPPAYGVAKKDPTHHFEASGASGVGTTGRIVENKTGRIFAMRQIRPGGPWRFQPINARTIR